MKKNLLMLSSLLALGVMATSCGTGSGNQPNNENTMPIEAVTSMNLLSKATNNQTKKGAKSLSDIDISQVKAVLPQLDLLLENGYTFDSTTTEFNGYVNDSTIQYEFKQEIKFKDEADKEAVYTLYYNQGITKEKVDEEDNEIKTKSFITGIATTNGETYFNFESKVTTEKEQDEYEEKTSFKLFVAEDSYIKVSQGLEKEGNEVETKFHYEVVNNGFTYVDYSIKIEYNKNNDKTLKYELGDKEFKFTKTTDKETNKTLYVLKYEDESLGKEFKLTFEKVVAEDGTVTFNLLTSYTDK